MKIQEKTAKKVFAYMAEHNMIAPGDSVVLGVSGGADSVCLLFLLAEFAKQMPISLSVVHVNHGIRQQAAQDAAYVRGLCEQLGLSFFLKEVDVPGLAAREKISEEALGRRVRYEAFEECARKLIADRTVSRESVQDGERDMAVQGIASQATEQTVKIAVAHNANDNAETMLFHLFRGTGVKGLCGIAPVRDNIIRPILCLERREIEEYLTERQIAWCEDHTNQEDDYTRNRIRHHILPYAEQEIVSGAVEHMNRTAQMLRETEDYLEQQTRAAMEKVCQRRLKVANPRTEMVIGQGPQNENQSVDQGNADCIIEVMCLDFQKLSPVLQKRILLSLAKELSPTGKDISLVHVEDMLSLFAREGNRDIHLPFGIVAKRRYEKVYLSRSSDRGNVGVKSGFRQEVEVGIEADGFTDDMEYGPLPTLTFTPVFPEKGAKPPTNQYTKWFDYDKISMFVAENGMQDGELKLRRRREGDYLTIADGKGGMQHKALKDYMVNAKIPREQRDSILVLALGSHVVWLIGYRISEYFKVTENTNHILQVQLIGDSNSSGK